MVLNAILKQELWVSKAGGTDCAIRPFIEVDDCNQFVALYVYIEVPLASGAIGAVVG